jgi:hypothetical protein
MAKQIPGWVDLQHAINNAYSAQYEAKSDTERLEKIALAVQQTAYGPQQALQALYER